MQTLTIDGHDRPVSYELHKRGAIINIHGYNLKGDFVTVARHTFTMLGTVDLIQRGERVKTNGHIYN